jgi:hypothetical protein
MPAASGGFDEQPGFNKIVFRADDFSDVGTLAG